MRHIWRNLGLLGWGLLLSICIIKFVNATDVEVTIDLSELSNMPRHSSRLHTLKLGSGDVVGTLIVKDGKARFSNGLIVGDNHSVNDATSGVYAVIGGGQNNQVANLAAVGGGQGNAATGENSVVVGGQNNKVGGQNAVAIGGQKNSVGGQNAVAIGGQNNKVGGQNAVAIGGKGNTTSKNSLLLGSGLFKVSSFSGRIDASSGVLINTLKPIEGVGLVVSGAVKIEKDGSKSAGEIQYVDKCFYAYDGSKWYVLNRGGEANQNSNCEGGTLGNGDGVAQFCKFGNATLQNGDTWTGYAMPYSTGCDSIAQKVTCSNGTLLVSWGSSDSIYPYCYTVHS